MKIRKATVADHGAMVSTLVRSFEEDPITNYILRQDRHRRTAFEKVFEVGVDIFAKYNELFTTEDLTGVAIWVPPNKWRLSFFQELLLLPRMIRTCSLARLTRAKAVLGAMKKNHPLKPHMYLYQLGVDPEHRKKGIGSSLLRVMLERCDRAGLPAYLENTNEANQDLYESQGFEVKGEIQVSSGAPKFWPMWRKPK